MADFLVPSKILSLRQDHLITTLLGTSEEPWVELKQEKKFIFTRHIRISSVQSHNHVQFFVTPWTAALQASLAITNSWSFLKCMSIESVMPSNHLNLCHPLLLLPSIFPSIRVFSNESGPRVRWPKYWSFSFSINPFN